MLTVTIIPVLKDNYSFILQSGEQCAVLDPGEADPVIHALDEKNLRPDYIFNTHHHGDHVAGNQKIKSKYKCKVIGPAADEERILGLDIPVDEQSDLTFGAEKIQVIETPGHTSGHVCFFFPDSKILFAGDTIFSMGCGRLFEGSPETMFTSLAKLKTLPPETQIYCGHEYTLSNAEFCHHARPDNQDITNKLHDIKRVRDNGVPTIPVTLAEELKTNVFLMAQNAQEFAELRAQKDSY